MIYEWNRKIYSAIIWSHYDINDSFYVTVLFHNIHINGMTIMKICQSLKLFSEMNPSSIVVRSI